MDGDCRTYGHRGKLGKFKYHSLKSSSAGECRVPAVQTVARCEMLSSTDAVH